jgi:hypothetical protein
MALESEAGLSNQSATPATQPDQPPEGGHVNPLVVIMMLVVVVFLVMGGIIAYAIYKFPLLRTAPASRYMICTPTYDASNKVWSSQHNCLFKLASNPELGCYMFLILDKDIPEGVIDDSMKIRIVSAGDIHTPDGDEADILYVRHYTGAEGGGLAIATNFPFVANDPSVDKGLEAIYRTEPITIGIVRPLIDSCKSVFMPKPVVKYQTSNELS